MNSFVHRRFRVVVRLLLLGGCHQTRYEHGVHVASFTVKYRVVIHMKLFDRVILLTVLSALPLLFLPAPPAPTDLLTLPRREGW